MPIVAAIGFSARSLLEALSYEGLVAVAVDTFGDHDTDELATSLLVLTSWGSRADIKRHTTLTMVSWLKNVALRANADGKLAVFLAGGTENWPELLDELHAHFQVLGPNRTQIKQLRKLDFWRNSAEYAELGFPEAIPAAETGRAKLGPWLRKALNGSGGIHVRRVDLGRSSTSWRPPSDSHRRSPETEIYLQREIPGRSLGVTCILGQSGSSANRCTVLGATESLTAANWLGPTEFIYRGSWGPVALTARQENQVRRLGEYVHANTGLTGWLQSDFIEDAYGGLWLLELNPRWAAGMEVLALTGHQPIVNHIRASDTDAKWVTAGRESQARSDDLKPNATYAAKAIVYAEQDFELTDQRLRFIHALPRASFADLPSTALVGHVIPAGTPLLTLRTRLHPSTREAVTEQELRRRLLHTLQELRTKFRQVEKI